MTLTKDQIKKLSDHLSERYNVLDPSGIVDEMTPEEYVEGLSEFHIQDALAQSAALYRKIFIYPQDLKQREFWSRVHALISHKIN